MPKNEVHISSLIVHVVPEFLPQVSSQITQLKGTEIYGDSPDGKIVVVLETDTHGFITDIIETINNFAHVISTVMVYHQIETELDNEPTNTGTLQSHQEDDV